MSYQSIELVCHNGHVIMEGAWDVERATREENEKLVREFAILHDLRFTDLERPRIPMI
jgi:hypothetical protein